MNTKSFLTKTILESIIDTSTKPIIKEDIKSAKQSWWVNPSHENRSFRLSPLGVDAFLQGGLKFYQIDLPDTLFISNKVMLWADRYIDCPYYYQHRSIYVSREKVAVQLMLFGGDLYKFGASIEKSKKKEKTA